MHLYTYLANVFETAHQKLTRSLQCPILPPNVIVVTRSRRLSNRIYIFNNIQNDGGAHVCVRQC